MDTTRKPAIFAVRYADGRVVTVEAYDSVDAVTKAQAHRPGAEIVSARYVGAYGPADITL